MSTSCVKLYMAGKTVHIHMAHCYKQHKPMADGTTTQWIQDIAMGKVLCKSPEGSLVRYVAQVLGISYVGVAPFLHPSACAALLSLFVIHRQELCTSG